MQLTPAVNAQIVTHVQAAGYRVGRQLSEKYMYNRPQLSDNLDVIRFICKELCGDIFRKQVTSRSIALHSGRMHA